MKDHHKIFLALAVALVFIAAAGSWGIVADKASGASGVQQCNADPGTVGLGGGCNTHSQCISGYCSGGTETTVGGGGGGACTGTCQTPPTPPPGGIIGENPTPPPPASSGGLVCGWAWGATNEPIPPGTANNFGVGWVSMNRKDCDTDNDGTMSASEAAAHPGCPAAGTSIPPYGVSLDGNGNLSGYAWSNNIGWINFDPGGAPPNGTVQAKFAPWPNQGNSPSYADGWIRAVAGGTDDSWDGWINLRWGNANNNAVGYENGLFSGYAWGGEVVGWLNFDPGTGDGVRLCSIETLAASLVPEWYLRNAETAGQTFQNTLTAYASGGAQQPYEFRFKCESTDPNWSSPQNGSSPKTFPCNYGEGTHVPQVKISHDDFPDAIAQATVVVNAPPGTGPGELLVTCNPTNAVNGAVQVNRPVLWEITAIPDVEIVVPPYNYAVSFDGVPVQPPIPSTPSNTITISKTYSTIGKKTISVVVTDSNTPEASEGACTSDVTIQVNPVIQPI